MNNNGESMPGKIDTFDNQQELIGFKVRNTHQVNNVLTPCSLQTVAR